jgi:chemotaxis signal transduction protein
MIPAAKQSFVLFPLGSKRFALPADTVTELARPDNLQQFPHRTPNMAGVLVRRGRIVPVCDVGLLLAGPGAPPRKFYLIAKRQFGPRQEATAIPVTGECELINAELVAPAGKLPAYVMGLLSLANEIVEVVDLNRLAMEVAA